MTRSKSPARLHCVFTLLLTCAFALALTGITNAATDTPQPPPAAAQTFDTDFAALKALVDQMAKDGVIALEDASMETNKDSQEIEEKVKRLLGL